MDDVEIHNGKLSNNYSYGSYLQVVTMVYQVEI